MARTLPFSALAMGFMNLGLLNVAYLINYLICFLT
jgi:hypothetical protein